MDPFATRRIIPGPTNNVQELRDEYDRKIRELEKRISQLERRVNMKS